MKESDLRLRSRNFAVNILQMCEKLDTSNGKIVLINQITKSSTSIGANIHEANYAQSKADFISKLQIALKECFETEYWLDLLKSVGYIDDIESSNLLNECGIIRKMLVKSLNTAKENQNNK